MASCKSVVVTPLAHLACSAPSLCCVVVVLLVVQLAPVVVPLPSPRSDVGAAMPHGVDPLAQFHNLLREALKYMHSSRGNSGGGGGDGGGATNVHAGAPPITRISGQVNARYPRSEIDNIAMKLINLQEMDRKFGAKARPRFGKRGEVTQDNFIPIYGDEEMQSSQQQEQERGGANGESPRPPYFYIP